MTIFSRTIKLLHDKLFKKENASVKNPDSLQKDTSRSNENEKETIKAEPSISHKKDTFESFSTKKQRDPYFIQIGYDFGTSFSKCIYREIAKNRAWIYYSSAHPTNEYPFLIPTSVICDQGNFRFQTSHDRYYSTNGLIHIKLALQKVALGEWNADVLKSYKRALARDDNESLKEFIESIAVFFLASSFQDVKNEIKNKFTDFGSNSNDQFAINMAIPVADASNRSVNSLFQHVLYHAWDLSSQNHNLEKISYNELAKVIKSRETNSDLCHVYPEVSANVQALIRSPAAAPEETAIYFFTDTGAGTVDQSVFTYTRRNSRLNYFASNVWLHGSSKIELLASQQASNSFDSEFLEYWRKKKENNSQDPQLITARSKIEDRLKNSTSTTINETLRCLANGPNVTPLGTLRDNSRLIFSGGGHTEFPYKSAVFKAYKNTYLPENFTPQTTSIRAPDDLDLTEHQRRYWMPRLYVAYGLSFLIQDLTKHEFPDPIPDTTPDPHPVCPCGGRNPRCPRCVAEVWG